MRTGEGVTPPTPIRTAKPLSTTGRLVCHGWQRGRRGELLRIGRWCLI